MEVDHICNMNSVDRNEKISEVLRAHPDGLIFSSRIHCDTTFELTDGHVTFILGECCNFK